MFAPCRPYPNGQTEKFALLLRAKPASGLVVAQGAGIFQVRKTDDSGLSPAGVSGRVAPNGAFSTISEAGSPAQVRGLRAGVVSEAAQLSSLCDRAIGATQADMATQMNIAGFNLAVRSRADVGAWVYDFMSGRRLDPGVAPAPGSLGVSVAPGP